MTVNPPRCLRLEIDMIFFLLLQVLLLVCSFVYLPRCIAYGAAVIFVFMIVKTGLYLLAAVDILTTDTYGEHKPPRQPSGEIPAENQM